MGVSLQFSSDEDWLGDGFLGMSHLCVKRGETLVAQLAWGVCDGLTGVPGPTGIVGCYRAYETDAGIALLREAQRLCVAQGARRVLGPMDGSTWGAYRLAFDDTGFPPRDRKQSFLFEPYNPRAYLTQFEATGFRPVTYYQSRLASDLATPRPNAAILARRITREGIVTGPLELRPFEETLQELWPLCRGAFRSALYYRDIDYSLFRRMHIGLLARHNSEFVRVARSSSGQLLAFIYAYPNSPIRSWEPENWIILKTLAVSPDCRTWGIGTHLADETHRLAHERGYSGVVHALMREGGPSVRISRQFASAPLRRYALFEWTP